MESGASCNWSSVCHEINVQGNVQSTRFSIITKRSIESIVNERELLANLRHKFIVSMVYAFQDEESLFIVMGLMEGGDLRYHLSKMTVFT